MPRKRVPIIFDQPYHITARCINREWFELPLPVIWEIMGDILFLVSDEYGLRIHAFVLMPNHFHLLMTAQSGNMDKALLYFMRESSKEITRLAGRINQTYGGRNHKTLITSAHYFLNSYKYVYQNPLRAGLAKRVEEYRYSTLNGLCGSSRINFPLAEDTILFNPSFDSSVLEWLNIRPSEDREEEMRLALKRAEFRFSARRGLGTMSPLESERL